MSDNSFVKAEYFDKANIPVTYVRIIAVSSLENTAYVNKIGKN
jgi:hypothetical protein